MRMLTLTAFALLFTACDGGKADDTGGGDPVDDVDADGYEAGDDCDDYDAAVNPGATEVPYNNVDEDCDGLDDDQDVDGDGSTVDVDCNDDDAAIHPGAEEVCDELDNDCDGSTDVGATDAFPAFVDADGDGFGNAESAVEVCELEAGYADNAEDCDDSRANVNPSAQEVCNDLDDDCDGSVNEDNPEPREYWLDSDGDGYGDAGIVAEACETPDGYVDNADDCDDTQPTVNPGATELCDAVDLNCDGDATAGASDAATAYRDGDGDGFGWADAGVAFCDVPAGYVADASDCDDTDDTISPAGTEVCDGVDQNCDGTADDGLDFTDWYMDADSDGYGDVSASASACAQPTGYVADATDCDDGDAASNPGGTEVCDGADNDCDGTDDEGATDARTWYMDGDADGYGDATVSDSGCDAPSGYVADATDCDDADPTEYPGASEVCDGDDDDCDGSDDEADAIDASTWYADADGDTFGDAASPTVACDQPTSYVADATDCDDASDLSYPGALELCGGGDENCDGAVDEPTALDASVWFADADGDTYGDAATSQTACDAPSAYVADDEDCDDTSGDVNPGATEACNDVDDDCDGSIDESGATGEATWYLDADGDGYGVADGTAAACDVPSGYAATADDCDDADVDAFPGATEADDLVDQDCDGWIDEDFVVSGDVIVTEVAKQPWVGGTSTNSNAFWFEVYNTSARTVDLSNWWLSHTAGSATDGFYVDPADALTVAPGEFLVFCKTDNFEADTSSTTYPLYCDYYWGDESQASSWTGTYQDNTFNLHRDDGYLRLWIEGDQSSGVEIDGVHWESGWPSGATKTISLDPAMMDSTSNDASSAWCATTGSTTYRWWSGTNSEYGTPGAANYDCP
ncbi:MAG: MopE-related protein [Myxococcota bacterium]